MTLISPYWPGGGISRVPGTATAGSGPRQCLGGTWGPPTPHADDHPLQPPVGTSGARSAVICWVGSSAGEVGSTRYTHPGTHPVYPPGLHHTRTRTAGTSVGAVYGVVVTAGLRGHVGEPRGVEHTGINQPGMVNLAGLYPFTGLHGRMTGFMTVFMTVL